MTFSITANVKSIVEELNKTFYETHIAYRLAMIHFICSPSLKSEL